MKSVTKRGQNFWPKFGEFRTASPPRTDALSASLAARCGYRPRRAREKGNDMKLHDHRETWQCSGGQLKHLAVCGNCCVVSLIRTKHADVYAGTTRTRINATYTTLCGSKV